VVPGPEVLATAVGLATRLARYPRQAVVETRRVLNLGLAASVASGLDGALAAEADSFTTDGFRHNLQQLLSR
jgi:hypothetical protein